MADVGEVKYKVEVDTSGVSENINNAQSKISSGFKKTGGAADAAANLIASGYAAKVASAVIGAGGKIAQFGLQFNMQMENYTTNFTTLLGSAEKAQKLVNDLKNMAAKTPFGTSDLADASQTLLAFGVSAEDLMPVLNNLGDISLGNKERFQNLALAFGQVSAAGKMTGQDLLQFVNAGFNPLKIIAEKTGESMEEVRDRMSEGGVTAQEVADAMATATSEGGQFFGAMENSSKTLEGRLSTLKDNASEAAGAMTSALVPALEKIVDWLSQAAQWVSQNQGAALAIAAVIGTLVVVLGTLSAAFSAASAISAIFGVSVGAAMGPILIVVGVIAALVAAGVLLYQNWETISAKAQEIWTGIGDFLSNLINSITKWFQEKWNSLMTWWQGLLQSISDFFQKIWQGISDFFQSIWDGIVSFFEDVWNGLSAENQQFLLNIFNTVKSIFTNVLNVIKTIWNNIKSAISSALNAIKSIVSSILSSVSSVFSSIWNGIKGTLGSILSSIYSTISSKLNSMKSVVSSVLNTIKGFFSNIWNSIKGTVSNAISNIRSSFTNVSWGSIGANIISGIANGILNGVRSIVNAARRAAQSAFDAACDFLGIHSPSRKFKWVGEMSGEGWEEGFDQSFDSIDSLIKNRSSKFLADANMNVTENLPRLDDYSRSIEIKGNPGKNPIVINVVSELDGREVARGTAWYMGEQLSWEEM
ncbi:MAG TPA: tape measure protein [Candidatus Mediterraneibacter vanvlietii]|nr:tape measure protein [Candidatus Mediterraneibacter vanvlietii]